MRQSGVFTALRFPAWAIVLLPHSNGGWPPAREQSWPRSLLAVRILRENVHIRGARRAGHCDRTALRGHVRRQVRAERSNRRSRVGNITSARVALAEPAQYLAKRFPEKYGWYPNFECNSSFQPPG